ncbi:Uracil DNA glycosylase superfamily protein [Paenibacillus sp. UNCCL117]|uniref:hypothetical protein n=1 Tax=unclassified Paenibacillus TaxID=185978 RepID=UPI00087EB216|nr:MULTISPECIES: hypothetical protein [unclassified Paenibacillus]SDD11872.1 Uracil DNA glycosylase superfamily protein [Paenibacillus sp. cl123]SFW33671.1 Uracil DNA glycosylase superfamily protein [Paenibacillus sp. UNCCL117]
MGHATEWDTYKQAICSLPADRPLTKEEALTDALLMRRFGQVEMYYAPHNEYVNHEARVVIIGITPGWTQMQIALEAARKGLEQQLNEKEIWKRAKAEARFAGAMRRNLISMLDELELHRYLGVSSSEALFREEGELLHTTSALKYPVFVGKQNYTGSRPPLATTPYLRELAMGFMRSELSAFPHALLIPLGRAVEDLLQEMDRENGIDRGRILWGFPHPSGANGHRHRQFAEGAERMGGVLKRLFG